MKLFRMISAVVAEIPRLFPLMRDARVPIWSKIVAGLLAALVVSPFDILGDVPVLGLIDDATLLLFILHAFVNFAERRAAYGSEVRTPNGPLMPNDDRRLVYSTDGTLPLPTIRNAKPQKPSAPGPAIPDDGFVRVGCERRRGGSLTLVYGLRTDELLTVAGDLKKRCGTGGTAKDGIVALQGDKRDVVIAYFTERKRRTKRMGG